MSVKSIEDKISDTINDITEKTDLALEEVPLEQIRELSNAQVLKFAKDNDLDLELDTEDLMEALEMIKKGEAPSDKYIKQQSLAVGVKALNFGWKSKTGMAFGIVVFVAGVLVYVFV